MLKWILIIIAALILFFVAVMIIDCHRFVARNYIFISDKVKKNKKYVMLSDLHSVHFGKNNQRLINKIIEINPDAILIAGDMYTAVKGENTQIAIDLVKSLAEKFKIYYANGNHEMKTRERRDEFGFVYDEYMEKLIASGVAIINNTSDVLEEDNVKITGLDLPFEFYQKFKSVRADKDFLNNLIGIADDSKLNLLIAHNPEYFEDYINWGADLVVSGHYHGGLMRLPIIGGVISPRYKLFPKYDYGEFVIGNSKMVLSCGLGTHTLPVRIFNPGEISVIEIKKK